MADEKQKTSTRVQLELPPKTMQRLENLKEKLEATSYAAVIKNALNLYALLLDEEENGKTICVKDYDGEITEYKIFLF
jgi:predicted DNA-binding protein